MTTYSGRLLPKQRKLIKVDFNDERTGAGTRPGNARKIRIRMNSRCLLLRKVRIICPFAPCSAKKTPPSLRMPGRRRTPVRGYIQSLLMGQRAEPACARDRRTDNNFTGMWLIAFVAMQPCVSRAFLFPHGSTARYLFGPASGTRTDALRLAPHVEYIPRILAVTAAQTLERGCRGFPHLASPDENRSESSLP